MNTLANLKIEYVAIDSIKPYEGNAKLHPDEQIEQIKKSIELMGFNDPIAVWQNGDIIEGHGRLIAAQQLGMKKVPIIRLDDLTDEQRRAYALIHNKLTMNSGFDMDILNVELEKITEFEMAAFDFHIAGDEPEDLYIDDFFDRGVEAKQKEEVFGIKIICESQEKAGEVYNELTEQGYEVEML